MSTTTTTLMSQASGALGNKEEAELSPDRQRVADFLGGTIFESCLGFLIFVNVVLIVVETNCKANRWDPVSEAVELAGECPTYLGPVNYCVVFLYIMELMSRLWVWRFRFFLDTLNVLDFAVVGIDAFIAIAQIIGVGAQPLLSLLRVARLVKLSRALRLMLLFPELNMMLRGLGSAMKAIFWGCVMMVLILVIFGVLAVQLINDVNLEMQQNDNYWVDVADCVRCPRAFESVQQSMLTFMQQILAGDSWGTLTVPIIEYKPITSVFFAAALVSVSLCVMNLILAVIVEKAQEAKQETVKELVLKKEQELERNGKSLLKLCKAIDEDDSGCLNLDEIMEGFRSNPEFQATLKLMDIGEEDMHIVFDILDEDKSGTVDYQEFVNQLQKMKSHDAHTLLIFIKYYVIQIRQKVEEQEKRRRRLEGAFGAAQMGQKHSERSVIGRHSQADRAEELNVKAITSEASVDGMDRLRQAEQEMLQSMRVLAEGCAEAQLSLLDQIGQLQAPTAALASPSHKRRSHRLRTSRPVVGEIDAHGPEAAHSPKPCGDPIKAAAADQPVDLNEDISPRAGKSSQGCLGARPWRC